MIENGSYMNASRSQGAGHHSGPTAVHTKYEDGLLYFG